MPLTALASEIITVSPTNAPCVVSVIVTVAEFKTVAKGVGAGVVVARIGVMS